MCSYAAAGLVIAVVGLAASAYSMDQQAGAVRSENRARQQSADNAIEATRQGYSATNARLVQEQDAATAAKFENAKRAAEAKATARVSSGEAGVAGLSVDALYADFDRQEAMYRLVTDTNLQYTQEQTQRDLKGLQATGNDRASSFRPEPVPDYLAAGVRLSEKGYDAYGRYRTDSGHTSDGGGRG